MSNVDTVYLIHHSHTDIGYTHDQPVVWDLHGRFIEEGVRLADKYSGSDTDGAFRWTVENTGVLAEWLKHAAPEKIARFIELERQGRIEVTAMFANITPLMDTDELIESFQYAGRLRDQYGFKITSAMNCDVNGENWPLVDLLYDLGVEGFSMAINTHFGGAPLDRPDVFWWEGPSGRKILAYSGWPYDAGWRFGIGHSEALLEDWWPRIQARLEAIHYPIPALMMQSFHPFGDNGPAFEGFTTFINQWNAQGKSPRLVLATPRMWWEAVKAHADQLPTCRGDWTDFWNFGCISSAREQAANRGSRVRLRSADSAAAATTGLAEPLPAPNIARTLGRYRGEAWKALMLWDEHTWGADLSLRAPESEDTAAQWYHKAITAYQARSLSQMLQRDAVADFSRLVARGHAEDLLLFNPLPWARRITGEVPLHVASPRGTPEDATAGRHSQDRVWSTDLWAEAAQRPGGAAEDREVRLAVPALEVPGYGYRVVKRAELVELKPDRFSEAAVVENERFRLAFDTRRGGVVSLFDKQLKREWVDGGAGYPLHGFVHEEVADKQAPWPRQLMFSMQWASGDVERERGWKPDWRANRSRAERVLIHRVYPTPLGTRVIQVLEAPGIVGPLTQSVFLPAGEDFIEFESWWVMGQSVHPEGTYLMFPFAVPGARARLDLGGQAMVAGEDQIPGVCFDYYTAQQWVDLSNDEMGVTVALPDNPMVQFGDFHFGHNQRALNLERAMLLGWVTNTYWETNFRAHQPGGVRARYRVYPHAGGFDPAAAQRAGLETAYSQPLLQHMGEQPGQDLFPAAGTLLRLPESLAPELPVFTLHIKPADQGQGMILRLYNAGQKPHTARVESALLKISSAELCDLTEHPLEALPVEDGKVALEIPSGQVRTIRVMAAPWKP